jgi:hypothetical protein
MYNQIKSPCRENIEQVLKRIAQSDPTVQSAVYGLPGKKNQIVGYNQPESRKSTKALGTIVNGYVKIF